MTTHAERKVLAYTPRQLFDLVAQVEKYPEFLPWVISAKVSERKVVDGSNGAGGQSSSFLAEVTIGYKMFKYPYKCYVHLTPDYRIDIEYIEGPFKYLNNHWIFNPINDKLTEIEFYMDFELKTPALQAILKPMFSEVVKRMINAFERRAGQMY